MQRTKIEWVINPDGTRGYSWNPITGCTNNCPYCWARRFSRRFHRNNFKPTFHPERLDEPLNARFLSIQRRRLQLKQIKPLK